MMNVFRLRAPENVAGRTLRVLIANCVERAYDLFQLRRGQDARCSDGARVGLAGSHFLGKKPPVKSQRSLPLFEVLVQWLAKAARPHLHWCASFFCSKRARVRAGSPRIWMKPLAPFWS